MFIFIGVAIASLGLGSTLLWVADDTYSVAAGAAGAVILSVSIVSIITLPVSYADSISDTNRFVSVQSSIESAHANGEVLSAAAIQNSIIEQNAWLADAQYWNSTVFEVYVTDRVDGLTPIVWK